MYVNLHSHSSFSDGAGTIEAHVLRAKELGQTALALTDHGTVGGWVTFWRTCREHDIKPIFGVEAYVVYEENKIGHMTLLAKNRKGFDNIIKLLTKGAKGMYKKGAVTLSDIVTYGEGVIVLSGCPSSPMAKGSDATKELFTNTLKAAFGHDFFIEVMFTGGPDHATNMLAFAKETKTPVVVTNDIHYPCAEDKDAHMIVHRMRYGYGYDNSDLHNKPYSEFPLVNPMILSGLTNSLLIANGVDDIDLSFEPELPAPTDVAAQLKDKIIQGLEELIEPVYGSPIPKEYMDRVVHEYGTIKKLGYIPYFYIVRELIQFANDQGIKYGPGRGSGAGSLILYLLRVTKVDPVKHGLIFERFLNESRQDYPDVDIDFDMSRRHEIIEYANKRWGAYPVATAVRYQHKSLVKDLGKWFKIDETILSKAKEDDKCLEFEELMEKDKFREAYGLGLNQIRHFGKHASGFIITKALLPLEKKGKTLVVPWGTGSRSDDLTPVGLIKFDILGLSNLSALARMEEITGQTPDDFGSDPKTMSLYASGKTNGIFQMTSFGAKRLALDVGPTTGEEISAIIALNRPGPLAAGTAAHYAEYRDKPRLVHPSVDDILEKTYGVIVYQEQVMKLFGRVTGLPDTDTDNVRKLVGKKLVDDPKWPIYERSFIDGCISNGMTPTEADSLWAEILTHSSYSFNESHSMAYAMISYETAWFKANYPEAFYAAMLEYDNKNAILYFLELVELGLTLSPPDINISTDRYEVQGDKVVMPFQQVHGVGPKAIDSILNDRYMNGPYASCEDFVHRLPKRVVNKRVKKSLHAVGAFDSFTDESELGLTAVELSIKLATSKREREKEYLGMVIPSTKLMNYIDDRRHDGLVIGIVESVKEKVGKWGPYVMIGLYPEQRYFANDFDFELDQGDVVLIELKNGRGRSIKTLSVL